jgi:catechol 2,3-dioxygenase-like lactoylglutathione lyase family enzyme
LQFEVGTGELGSDARFAPHGHVVVINLVGDIGGSGAGADATKSGDTHGVSAPLIEGPGPPDSVVRPPEHRVSGLIPFVHVGDVQRSIDFYHHLGFVVASVYKYRGKPAWAELCSNGAELMVTTGKAIDQAGQGVLFYLYSDDLAALRGQLLADGIDAGEIVDGTPGPRQEMRLTDPDGYVLMVAQIEPREAG